MALERGPVYRVTVLGSTDGQACINVLDYRNTATVAPAAGDTLAAFLAAFRSDWQTFILPFLNVTYGVMMYRIEEIVGVKKLAAKKAQLLRGQMALQVGTTADIGQAVGTATPSFEAFGIRKLTGMASRKFRGNMRLGPVLETDTTVNTVGAAQLTALQTALDGFVLDEVIINAVMELVVFSIQATIDGIIVGQTAIPPYDATAPEVQSLFASQFISTQVSRKRRGLSPA